MQNSANLDPSNSSISNPSLPKPTKNTIHSQLSPSLFPTALNLLPLTVTFLMMFLKYI